MFLTRVELCVRRGARLRTDEGGDLGVDDAAGQEVKVVLHRVHHHRVSRVVAALQTPVGDTDEQRRKTKPPRENEHFLSGWRTPAIVQTRGWTWSPDPRLDMESCINVSSRNHNVFQARANQAHVLRGDRLFLASSGP